MKEYDVSLVIATFNSEKYIEECIASCLEQKGCTTQIIVIDGGSSDKTSHLAMGMLRRHDIIISEPDHGVYDAWNKALPMLEGRWILFRGSDDIFVDSTALAKLVNAGKNTSCELIFGDTIRTNKNLQRLNKLLASEEMRDLEKIMSLPHPSLLHNISLFTDHKLTFDTNYKVVADYEMLLKTVKLGIQAKYVQSPITYMREGGLSNQKDLEGHFEAARARLTNGFPPFSIISINQILRCFAKRYIKPLTKAFM